MYVCVYMYTCVYVSMYVCDLQRKAFLFRLKNYVYVCVFACVTVYHMYHMYVTVMEAKRGKIPWGWSLS